MATSETTQADGAGAPSEAEAADASKDFTPRWAWGQERPTVMAGPTVPTEDLFRPHGGSNPTESSSAGSPMATSAIPAVQPDPADTAAHPIAGRRGTPGSVTGPAMVGPGAIAGPSLSSGRTPTAFVPAPANLGPAEQRAGTTGVDLNTRADGGRLGAWSTFFLILVLTTAGAFLDEAVSGALTWITGATFVVACLLGAVLVKRRDLATAVISPPLAFLVALILSAQPDALRGDGNLFVKEASALITGLAFNAPWIFAGTALALVVVLIRRTRFRGRDTAAHAG